MKIPTNDFIKDNCKYLEIENRGQLKRRLGCNSIKMKDCRDIKDAMNKIMLKELHKSNGFEISLEWFNRMLNLYSEKSDFTNDLGWTDGAFDYRFRNIIFNKDVVPPLQQRFKHVFNNLLWIFSRRFCNIFTMDCAKTCACMIEFMENPNTWQRCNIKKMMDDYFRTYKVPIDVQKSILDIYWQFHLLGTYEWNAEEPCERWVEEAEKFMFGVLTN